MKKKLVFLICYVLLEIAEHGQSVELECEKEGYVVVQSENCGVYYYCVKTANNVFYAVKFECPLGEGFSLLKLKCIPEDINECGKLPGKPIEDPILSDEFVCPSSGRFPDVESPDCKSYYMCSNVLEPVLNNCPATTIFSWVSMKCVVPTGFTCPNAITTTTEASTIITEVTTVPDGFVCITEGRFADPQSVNCKSYYLCVTTTDGNIYGILSQCPSTTVFSPGTQKCVVSNQYECPTTTAPTDPSTTEAATATPTEEPTSETIEPNAFVCTDIGRFPDPVSTDCTTYYLCTISIDGIYEAILNQCPSTTIFSPIDQKCLETGYQCSVGTTAMTDEPSTIESTTFYTTDVEVTTQDPSTSETTETVELTTASSTTDTENQSTDSESTSETTTEHNAVTTPYPQPFICTSYGRFSDPKSTDCKGYYLCTDNTEGFLEATPNRCPSVTIFYPETGKCVMPTDYQCPTVETTTLNPTEEPSTVVTTVAPTEAPTVTTPEESTTVVTTDLTIPMTDITTTNESSTSATEEPTLKPPGESFACTEYGRFPDPKSTDCKGYYLCTENTEGFFEATLNKCPSVTIFHPENGKCVMPTDYQCHMVETTTPDFTETTVPSTEAPTEPTTSEPSTPVLTTDITTPTTATSATGEPTPDPPGESFACTEYGRFPDPQSTDCKGYYLCTENTEGFFEATLNKCPSVTIFHPANGKCVQPTDYQCSAVETTTSNPTEEPSTVETTVPSTETPTQPSTSEPSTPVLTTDSIIPTTATSATDKPTPDPPSESFTCTEYGRFPDPQSTDCKGYYLCTETAEGFFEATHNKCPSVTIFHPANGKCVQPTDYQCPAVETTTSNPTGEPSTFETTVPSTEAPTQPSTSEPSTPVLTTDSMIPTTSTSGTDVPTPDPPSESFSCTEYGRFPDPQSTDCKGYYLCTENTEGLFEATLNKCPSVTIFNPQNGKCVQPTDYQCSAVEITTPDPTEEPSTVETTVPSTETPTQPSTSEPSTPLLTTQVPPPSESFGCTAVGRFPDPTSTDCKGYYLCSTNAAGAYEAVLTQCPSVTIFSAEQNRCVLMSQYQCPTAITTSTVEPTTLETTPSSTTSSGNFICTSTGRHPDPTQPDCSKYKYCLLTATNEFLEYTFNCPSASYFNPLELRCSIGYSCPALSPTATPEATTELSLMTTPFYCTSDGRFADPTSEGCDTYIMCLRTAVGNFLEYNFKCPSGSLFNPDEAKCSTSYLCI